MNLLNILSFSCALLTYGSFIWAAERYFANKEQANPSDYNFIKIAGLVFILTISFAQLVGNPSNAERVVGMALLLLSFGLLLWSISVQQQGKLDFAFTGNQPTFLTTKGPYGLVRHPVYLSYLLGWIGGSVASGYYVLLVSAIIMGRYYIKAINQEESLFAVSKFGEAYNNYCKNTARLIPLIY